MPILGLILLIAGVSLYDRYAPSPARRALPESATEVQEYYHGFFNGDYTRCIKAKMPNDKVDSFAAKLKLNEIYEKGRDVKSIAGLDTISGSSPAWFDSPRADDSEIVRYAAGTAWLSVLKYKSGYVYLMEIDW